MSKAAFLAVLAVARELGVDVVVDQSGPVIRPAYDASDDMRRVIERMSPHPTRDDIPPAKKKCDRCHRWTGGAHHFCRGRR